MTAFESFLSQVKDELIVFARIGLYILSGYLASADWLPAEVKAMLTSPEMVETVTGLAIGALTIVWYLYSKARVALQVAALPQPKE